MDVVQKIANLALRCISLEPKLRPKMKEIVKELELLQDLNSLDYNHSKTHDGSRPRRRSAGDSGNKVANSAYPRPSTSPPHSR